MKKQVYNPILPLDEYIADGEPHVFGDRVYIFGSHDRGNGDTYCMLDYVFWSAPVDDLSDWTNKGVSYSVSQDPNHSEKLKYMYAPDVVWGNDGRYYLYYCLSGEKGAGGYGQPISVAVCDTPDGKYEYHGFVRWQDGSPMLKYVTFDPAVINDSGAIRLYYGTWYPFHERARLLTGVFHIVESRLFQRSVKEIAACPDGIMGANHVELMDDMLTVKTEPVHMIPFKVKGTGFEEHPFFEASSIRRIGDTYYFIYSSIHGHELCYATSKYPDRDFEYRGTIVSNGDVGYKGRKPQDRLNTTGTNHGSIEQINGRWYVFYHRNTNKTAYSRQVCAEPIEIMPDGSIPQVEISSQGINCGPLKAEGTYPAAICCNLTNGRMPHQGNGIIKKDIPYISCGDGEPFVVTVNGTTATYKYFDFPGGKMMLRLKAFAKGSGQLRVILQDSGEASCSCEVQASEGWKELSVCMDVPAGIFPLSFMYSGTGSIELKEFELTKA